MEFIGIGWQEALFVGLLMLIVVGPDRLPEVAYHAGRWVRRLQLYARVVRDEFRGEFEYLEAEYKTVQSEINEATAEFKKQQSELDAEFRRSTAEITDAAKSVERTVREPVAPSAPAKNGTATSTVRTPVAASKGTNGTSTSVSAGTSKANGSASTNGARADDDAPAERKPPIVF